jgi:hypothetical protein
VNAWTQSNGWQVLDELRGSALRALGVERTHDHRSDQPQVGEETELFEHRTKCVPNHRSVQRDQGEALSGELPKKADVQLRFRAASDAFQEGEDRLSGGR